MSYFLHEFLGQIGVLLLIGTIIFFYSYINSVKIIDWVERQTFGTRDYIIKKADLLFLKIDPDKLTYMLLFSSLGISVLILGIASFFGHLYLGLFLAVITSVVGWKLPRPVFDFLVNRRISKYASQMVDALNLLANGLRAGLSLVQSLGMVVDEMPDPISQEFNLIIQQNRLGVPLEECFENLYTRVPTEDNQMFVSSINILRETGGNLPETFDTITHVIRERMRLQQKIETYIAQSKYQGIAVFLMPFIMLILFGMTDPELIGKIFTSPIGIILFIVAIGINLMGGFVIYKITQIKV